MVAIKKKPRRSPVEHISEVVCPDCGKLLPYPCVLPVRKLERYGLLIRTYFGWCFDCERGCEVIQFCSAGTWQIHKYRPYTVDGPGTKPRHGRWQRRFELPVAPVLVGPGGDYCDTYDLAAGAGQ